MCCMLVFAVKCKVQFRASGNFGLIFMCRFFDIFWVLDCISYGYEILSLFCFLFYGILALYFNTFLMIVLTSVVQCTYLSGL
ncbi:hypothetical protein OIU79_007782 [Salix purpurea]|uniref:Uncharacterized protein n=1 Tax=Salix purpurea TaxID=77065 RepID=A0A9Q0TGT1_SALPP|nr:hypothetical protein OIU79_007782 [Salix purpurea]